jgi:hypothetical protein
VVGRFQRAPAGRKSHLSGFRIEDTGLTLILPNRRRYAVRALGVSAPRGLFGGTCASVPCLRNMVEAVFFDGGDVSITHKVARFGHTV